MRTSRIAILFVLMSVGFLLAAQPRWLAAWGFDPFGVQQTRTELEDEGTRQEHLRTLDSNVCRRMEVKESLVLGLIAGRRTLAEVTAEFLALNQDYPEYMKTIRSHYAGETDVEKTARNVIGYVQLELRNEPNTRQSEVLLRLEAEYAAMR